MSDLISKQRAIEAIDKFIPADPMMSDYTQGISVGLAIATRCIEEFSQENHDSSQGLVKDLISRKDAIDEVEDTDWYHQNKKGEMVHGANPADHQAWYKAEDIYKVLNSLPSAEKAQLSGEDATKDATSGLIRRQDVLHWLDGCDYELKDWQRWKLKTMVRDIPSAEPEIIRCKDCKHFEYDHFENVNGIPLIVAHEICMKWCEGTKTSENGYCFLAERKDNG